MDARRLVPVAFFLLVLLPASMHAVDRPVDHRPVLVCYGDSITAGYGLDLDQAYPALLQRKLAGLGYNYSVINQGTSGATTKDAVAELPAVLRLHPAVVILEFGGNDGLRGLPVAESQRNLDRVLSGLQNAHARIVLAGITLPPQYGQEYIRSFEQMFRTLAASHHVALIPMLYVNLVHVPGTIQGDGIHPTAKGSAIIAATIFQVLKPMLRRAP